MTVKALHNYFAQHPEAFWIMRWPNAQTLYNFVKKEKPKKILDLGTGIGVSSAIMALAMKDAGVEEYEIHTVEQTEKCFKLAQELIPEDLRQNIKFYRFDPVIWYNSDIPYQSFSTFKELPEGDWDLIINDGPGPFLENGHYLDFNNGDVMKMLVEGKLKVGVKIFFDGRISTLRSIERYYDKNFYLCNTPNREYNIIEKKDVPLQFRDVMKDDMEKAGYLKAYAKEENTPHT